MLSSFFSRKQPKKDLAPKGEMPSPEQADTTYDPGLIAVHTEQHRALVMLLIRARNAAQQARYEEVKGNLEQFKSGLENHLYQEGVGLLPYLIKHLTGDDRKMLKEMQANTNYIERTVSGFLEHYIGYPVTDRNAERFDAEIEGVSEEFSERIQREETSLYVLYMPPESYQTA
jgi:hypothetical protein